MDPAAASTKVSTWQVGVPGATVNPALEYKLKTIKR